VEPVVNVLVVVLVSGRVKVNVTEAPEAGAEPWRTVAVMGTVEFVAYVDFGTDTVAARIGTGGITVTLAFAVTKLPELWAVASTTNVAGAVPLGTDFVMVAGADEAGEIVNRLCEKLAGHELGNVELRSKDRGEHPNVSLLVTDTV